MIIIVRLFVVGMATLLGASLAGCGGGGGGGGGDGDAPAAVAPADNTPRFAYAINSQVIGSYVVDPESGNLIPRGNSQQFFETAPTDIAVHPNGRFLYLSDAGGLGAIKRRRIDPQTGVFATEMADYATADVRQIAIHPAGEFLFFRKSGVQPITTLAIDPASGDLSLADETAPRSTSAMHLAPDGGFVYAVVDIGDKQIQTYRVEGDGSLTAIDADPGLAGTQPQSFSNTALGLGFNPVRRDVYLVDLGGANIERYARDTGSGLLAFVDSTPLLNATVSPATNEGVHVEPLGRFGYVRLGNDRIAGFRFDPGDGSLTPIDYDPLTPDVQHLDFGPDAGAIQHVGFEPSGRFVYFGFTGTGPDTLEKYAIDQATGELSQSATGTELNRILGLGAVTAMTFSTREGVPDPGPTFAYSRSSDMIVVHEVDAATGTLTAIDSLTAPALFRGIYVDPAQQYLYLGESLRFARVRIDQQTGALSDWEARDNAQPNTLGTGRQGPRFDPHNRFAVQSRSNGEGMDLMEVVTGPPGGLGPSKTDIQFSEDPYPFTGTLGASAVRPNSRHIYSTGLVFGTSPRVLRMFELVATPVSFDRVDASTAAGHQDFPLPTDSSAHDTIVEPLGRYLLNLEVASPGNSDNLAVYELDWTTGLPTRRNASTTPSVVLNHTTGPSPLHIVPDPRGRFVYVPHDNGIAAFRFTRNPTGPALEAIDNDPATGGLQQAVPMGGSARIAIDPTGQWLYSPGSLGTEAFAIDPATGALTSVGLASPDTLVDLQVLGNL